MRENLRPADEPPAPEPNLSRYFKALADDTRRAILTLLEHREHNVTEIVARFDLTQPTISRHLQVLREARLVRSERRGQHMVYRLDPETLVNGALGFFGRFRGCRREGIGSGSAPPPPTELKPIRRARPRRRFRFDG